MLLLGLLTLFIFAILLAFRKRSVLPVFFLGLLLAFIPARQRSASPDPTVAALGVLACGTTPAVIPAITTDVGQVTVCVEEAILAQVNAGTTTFEDIATAIGASCGAITSQEVQNIVDLWTSGTTDGGADVLAKARPKLKAAMGDTAFVAKLKALKHK